MKTLALLSSGDIYPAIIAAIVIAIMGGALSIFVVLKRLAFIGQGVSHAAFGGVGLALVLGITGATVAGQISQLGVVVAFSVLAALWIAALTRDQKGRTDTAIGVVLSASMALGFILFTIAESLHAHDDAGNPHADHQDEHHVIEEILFGNILHTTWATASIAIAVAVMILGVVWYFRRQLVFWAFDESVCDAFGINSAKITNLFMVLLALAIVMAMQIAGVVLAAAMLVLPGAAALNLSTKLRPAFMISITIGTLGAILGMFVGFEGGFPIGPSIVLAQSLIYLGTLIAKKILIARLRS